MSKTPPTPMEVDSLRQLKVIRSDNPIFKSLTENYIKIALDYSYLKNSFNDVQKHNEELIDDNYRLNDELSEVRKMNRILEKSNATLRASLRIFLLNLQEQGIVAVKEDGSHDITI